MSTTDRATDRQGARELAGLAIWTAAWLVTLAIAQFGPELWWGRDAVAGWVAVGANLVAGAGWVTAQARFIRGRDDLQRKVLLDALAITLGVGFVGAFSYAVAEAAGLIAFDGDIAILAVVMGITYLAAIAGGTLRYR